MAEQKVFLKLLMSTVAQHWKCQAAATAALLHIFCRCFTYWREIMADAKTSPYGQWLRVIWVAHHPGQTLTYVLFWPRGCLPPPLQRTHVQQVFCCLPSLQLRSEPQSLSRVKILVDGQMRRHFPMTHTLISREDSCSMCSCGRQTTCVNIPQEFQSSTDTHSAQTYSLTKPSFQFSYFSSLFIQKVGLG